MTTYERQLPPHHTEWIVSDTQVQLQQTRSITIEDPGDLAMLKHCLQAIKESPDKEYTYNRLDTWLFLEYKKNKTPQALPSREPRLSILRTRPQRQELDLTLDEALALLERLEQ